MYNVTSMCVLNQPHLIQVVYIGLTLNCCVIFISVLKVVTIWRTPALHSNANCFIASLAISDIIMAFTVVGFTFLYFTPVSQYIHNSNIIDSVLLGMVNSSNLFATVHFIIIAIDRHMYILKPFCYIKYMMTKRMYKLVLLVWVLTLIYLITPLVFYTSNRFHKKCIFLYPPKEYFIVVFAVGLTAYTASCVFYFRISRVAFQRKVAKNVRRELQDNPVTKINVRGNRRAAMKSIKFFMSMCGASAVYHTPKGIVTLMGMFSYNVPMYIYLITNYLLCIHVLLTFCVYFKMNRDVASKIKRQLLGCSQMTCL